MRLQYSIFVFIIVLTVSTGITRSQTPTPSPTDDQKVYLSSEVDERLQVKEKVKARYTEEARKNCINGKVLLEGIFRPNGTVNEIKVLKGLGGGLN